MKKNEKGQVEKESFIEETKAKMDEWSAELDKLKSKAERAEGDVKYRYKEQIEMLQDKQKIAQETLAELQKVSDESWTDFKEGMHSTLTDIKKAMEDAKSKLK
ncbi:MAG TPA: coiled coil domain-containing protein [Methanotrichaceae archaeon]|nr:coiled coil domain-containing protein [Methanotrichaceae archaeon]